MKKTAAYLLAALALTACTGNDEPEPDPIVSNIVTYEATTDDGAVSTFTFRAVNDSPLITISANWKAPSDLKAGTRLLAYYVTEKPNESGPVELRSLVKIPGGAMSDSTGIEAPFGEGLGLQALWRSGTYLNLNTSIYFSGKASEVSLYVDPATVSSPRVDAYIAVGLSTGAITDSTVPRLLVASWDIADVWELPTLTSLNVHYLDRYERPQAILFEKSNQ